MKFLKQSKLQNYKIKCTFNSNKKINSYTVFLLDKNRLRPKYGGQNEIGDSGGLAKQRGNVKCISFCIVQCDRRELDVLNIGPLFA